MKVTRKLSEDGGWNMSVEERVKELGIILPVPAKPVAEYVPVKQVGKLLYISGQDCKKDGKLLYEGKVGKELSVEQGQEAARQCMVNALGVLKQYLGNLDIRPMFLCLKIILVCLMFQPLVLSVEAV